MFNHNHKDIESLKKTSGKKGYIDKNTIKIINFKLNYYFKLKCGRKV